MTWPCPTPKDTQASCKIIPRTSCVSQVLSTVCFTFGHAAEAACEHAGRTNWFDLISPYFTIFHQFPISPWVLLQFHHFHKFSLKVGKETTAFEPGRKIPGRGRRVEMFWTPTGVVGWSVRSRFLYTFVAKKSMIKVCSEQMRQATQDWSLALVVNTHPLKYCEHKAFWLHPISQEYFALFVILSTLGISLLHLGCVRPGCVWVLCFLVGFLSLDALQALDGLCLRLYFATWFIEDTKVCWSSLCVTVVAHSGTHDLLFRSQ